MLPYISVITALCVYTLETFHLSIVMPVYVVIFFHFRNVYDFELLHLVNFGSLCIINLWGNKNSNTFVHIIKAINTQNIINLGLVNSLFSLEN